MFSATKDLSAMGRGVAQASASGNDYRVVLPRLPTGKLVVDSIFLHADLAGRPYRVQDFRDALREIIDLKEISSIGQFQMSHVWMVTCKSTLTKTKLVTRGEFFVKNRRCLVIDPEPTEVKMKLMWLPEHLEDAYIREALQVFGKVKTISKESWKVADMEQMQTLNRDVVLSLADGVRVGDVPHILYVCGVQSLVLIPGRPPLCLRCSKVGHIRRNCRTPRCDDCRRFGHSAEDCVVTYANKLRQRTQQPDDSLQEHIMDATEVLDATGDTPSTSDSAGSSKKDPEVTRNSIAVDTVATSECKEPGASCKQLIQNSSEQPQAQGKVPTKNDAALTQNGTEEPLAQERDLRKDPAEVASPACAAAPQQPFHHGVALDEDMQASVDTTVPKRRATYSSDSSKESDPATVSRKSRRRRTSPHHGKCRRSRSRRPEGGSREASPSTLRTDHMGQ
ncbi:uncharacterized protein LOC125757522 [Rhipicephalus sanguineus]|uniref:uncharacterized protein LOC125757522 n=1 Tax=Rhipicephalus sanguineus TaxID=34632 RepID=UPI0020C5A53E|nr:uncharacterized protein LOC125757522 [Rhipicephalus sanguineus]